MGERLPAGFQVEQSRPRRYPLELAGTASVHDLIEITAPEGYAVDGSYQSKCETACLTSGGSSRPRLRRTGGMPSFSGDGSLELQACSLNWHSDRWRCLTCDADTHRNRGARGHVRRYRHIHLVQPGESRREAGEEDFRRDSADQHLGIIRGR